VPRWFKVCQQCWQEEHPDAYCPDLTDYDTCFECGQQGLVLSVSFKDLSELTREGFALSAGGLA
jgi:hypothetical protein